MEVIESPENTVKGRSHRHESEDLAEIARQSACPVCHLLALALVDSCFLHHRLAAKDLRLSTMQRSPSTSHS